MKTEQKVNIHAGSLYDYTTGAHCGVLVTEKVMKKLAKIQSKHLQEVKTLLANENESGNVYASMWTLHYPNDKQTTVRFIDTTADVSRRIELATSSNKPIHYPLVFKAESMKEAARMADIHHG